MELETKRLILRPWRLEDAEDMYELARDPEIGAGGGWNAHKSVEESRGIARMFMSSRATFAVVPKDRGRIIGVAGLKLGDECTLGLSEDEGDIGYWIGKPFWGNGYATEAVLALLRLAVEDLRLERVWAGYFDGNERSKRVLEKCGFSYHHTNNDILWELTGKIITEHVMNIDKKEYGGIYEV